MVSEGYGLSNEKPNWQDEIEEILAKSNWETEPDWEQVVPEMVRMMTGLLALSMAPMVIHSPEGRERIREVLTEEGLAPEKIEQAIYWIICSTTKPMIRKEK